MVSRRIRNGLWNRKQGVADVDDTAELRKLADLRDRGVLTPSEYQIQEARVLHPPLAALAHDAAPADEAPRRRRRLAERSNFTAVLALLCAVAFWPAGIMLGYQARREARQTEDGDERLALAALVIAYVAAGLTVVIIILRAS
jgi:hypothetical protein